MICSKCLGNDVVLVPGRRYCKVCRAAELKAWRVKNASHVKEYDRAYVLANKSRIQKVSQAYRLTNANKIAQRQALYRNKNRDLVRAWGVNNYYKRKARIVGEVSAAQIAVKMEYYGHTCWMCGSVATTLDHVKPISRGGPHMLSNLRPACKSCNSSKRDKWFGVSQLHSFIR